MTEAALVAHIIAQTQSNISFLQVHGYLNTTDAANIQTRLAAALTSGRNMGNDTSSPSWGMVTSAPPPPPQASAPEVVKARALWAYNEDGSEPKDLSFSVGEVIEIVEETSADWWTGRARGRQGLFPSNYIEKLPQAGPKRAYKPFMAAHHGADAPPAANGTVTNSVGLQEADGQEKKKSKFGKYGNTMAHSAAGGVGFGAGAAIGGGLVRAIF